MKTYHKIIIGDSRVVREMRRFFALGFLFFLSFFTFEDLGREVKEYTLPNGLKLIVLKRGLAPVFTFRTYADVGAVDETSGQTGLAHLFEHMAFKGSSSIGSKDPKKEKEVLKYLESAYQNLRNARRTRQPPEIIQQREKEFLQWKQKAQEYAETNEFGMIINLNGGVGLNAFTNADSTQYFYSLPSNRLELWAYLESERFADPVMREFYQEKDVVLEERRLRNESSPTGKLYEVFLSAAFHAHPYGRPVIGYRSDLEDISATEAENFFRTFYGAKNLVIAVVGQVEPDEVYRVALKHLSKIPAGGDPPPVVTREPLLPAEKTVVLYEKAQPALYIGYPVPEFAHPDRPALELLSLILSSGRSSILYSELVKKRKLVSSLSTFFAPGNKYPRLFTISAFPLKGISPQEVLSGIDEIFATITSGGITQEDLERARNQWESSFIAQLESDFGLSGALAFYEVLTGSWKNLFAQPEIFRSVTLEDIHRVAKTYLNPSYRTIAYIPLTPPKSGE